MKLSVTGSRHWTDRELIFITLDQLDFIPEVIIHGGAKGVDLICADWAAKALIPCAIVLPVKFESRYYLDRDEVIVNLGDTTIAFREKGISNGTDFTIKYAIRKHKLHPASIIRK